MFKNKSTKQLNEIVLISAELVIEIAACPSAMSSWASRLARAFER